MPKAGGQASGPAVKPPLMRSQPPANQATAHSLHTQAWAATQPLARQHQSAVGLHLRNPSLMDYYSFNRPRRDGRLCRPCWLTDSGRFTHKEVTWPAVSLHAGQGKHSGRTGGLNHYATPPTLGFRFATPTQNSNRYYLRNG